jgi:hypothetical protein
VRQNGKTKAQLQHALNVASTGKSVIYFTVNQPHVDYCRALLDTMTEDRDAVGRIHFVSAESVRCHALRAIEAFPIVDHAAYLRPEVRDVARRLFERSKQ